jgi:hypothetical protein
MKIGKNHVESQSWARWLDSKGVDSTKFGVQSAPASILLASSVFSKFIFFFFLFGLFCAIFYLLNCPFFLFFAP